MPLQGELPGPDGGMYKLTNFDEAHDPGAEHSASEANRVVDYDSRGDMNVGPERTDNGAIPLGPPPVASEAAHGMEREGVTDSIAASVENARGSVLSALYFDTTDEEYQPAETQTTTVQTPVSTPTPPMPPEYTRREVRADSADEAGQAAKEPLLELSLDDAVSGNAVVLDTESQAYVQRRQNTSENGIDANDWLDEYDSATKEPGRVAVMRDRVAAKWSDSTPEKLTRDERYAVAETAKGIGRAALWTVRRTMESFDDGIIRKTSDLTRQGLNARFDKAVAPPRPPVNITREADKHEGDTMDAEKYDRVMNTYDRREQSLHRNEKKILDAVANGEEVDNSGEKRADIDGKLQDIRTERWSAMRRQPRGADSVEFHDKDLDDMSEMYQENLEEQAKNQKRAPRNSAERGEQRKDAQALKRQQDRILQAVEGRNPNPVAAAGNPTDRGPGNLFSREGVRDMWSREGYGSNERRLDRVVGPRTADGVRRGGRAAVQGLVDYANNRGFRGNNSAEGEDNAPERQTERLGQNIGTEDIAPPPISQVDRLDQDIAVVRAERSEIQTAANATGRSLNQHELGRMDELSSRLSDLATQQQMLIANDRQREEEPVAG